MPIIWKTLNYQKNAQNFLKFELNFYSYLNINQQIFCFIKI